MSFVTVVLIKKKRKCRFATNYSNCFKVIKSRVAIITQCDNGKYTIMLANQQCLQNIKFGALHYHPSLLQYYHLIPFNKFGESRPYTFRECWPKHS